MRFMHPSLLIYFRTISCVNFIFSGLKFTLFAAYLDALLQTILLIKILKILADKIQILKVREKSKFSGEISSPV